MIRLLIYPIIFMLGPLRANTALHIPARCNVVLIGPLVASCSAVLGAARCYYFAPPCSAVLRRARPCSIVIAIEVIGLWQVFVW